MKISYPVLFTPEESGGYSVYVPDMNQIQIGCYTCGDTFEEAYEMVLDAIGLALEDIPFEKYPVPSAPNQIEKEDSDIIVMVEFDLDKYMKSVEEYRKSQKIQNICKDEY